MKVSSVREWVPIGERTDKVGRIVVRVILIDRGKNKNMKGNLTRTFTVNDATVSEVAELTRGACQRTADLEAETASTAYETTENTGSGFPPAWGVTH